VVSASSIGAARGGGYARYLEAKTVAPERGDYYLTPDVELAQAPGRWLADPETLASLGIDPDGPVAGGDFIALMEGRHPGTGMFLRPEGAGACAASISWRCQGSASAHTVETDFGALNVTSIPPPRPLFAGPERPKPERPLEDRVEARLVEHHAVFDAKDLRTVTPIASATACLRAASSLQT
jgi:hypothetical protein